MLNREHDSYLKYKTLKIENNSVVYVDELCQNQQKLIRARSLFLLTLAATLNIFGATDELMRSSQDVTCVKERAERVRSIKGKQMVRTSSAQRFLKPLLRYPCSDWPSALNRRPRRSQSERAFGVCPRRVRLVHVLLHESSPLSWSEVAQSAVLF